MNALLNMITSHFDMGVVSDFGKVFNMIFTIVLIVAAVLAWLYLFKWVVFKIYIKTTNETIQSAVTDIIYQLDSLADSMTNKEKRKAAINGVRDLFIWRAIPIPSMIIGIIIDLEVAAIRKLQKQMASEKDPYLHPDEEVSDKETTKSEVEEREREKK